MIEKIDPIEKTVSVAIHPQYIPLRYGIKLI